MLATGHPRTSKLSEMSVNVTGLSIITRVMIGSSSRMVKRRPELAGIEKACKKKQFVVFDNLKSFHVVAP